MSDHAHLETGMGTSNPTGSAAPDLRFEILGPLRVTRNGTGVNLGGPQQRGVLALLLINSETPLPVSRIADALWGENPPPGHATTVQTYVFHLRAALEPGRARGAPARILVTDHGGYRLDTAGAVVDVHEFEARAHAGLDRVKHGDYETALAELDAALGLWRGDVLADLAELGGLYPVAARLNELRLSTIEAWIDARLALGGHASIVGDLDELTEAHPLRERLHAQRMLALYRCGRQADALAAYRHLHRDLDDEIGVEPSRPLRDLHQAILTHDPSLSGVETSAEPAPARSAQASVGGPARRGQHRRRSYLLAAGAVTVLVAGTLGAALVLTHPPQASLAALPANSVGVVHADGSLHDAVSVGQSPAAVAYASGSIWAANGGANTVMRIDPRTHAVTDQIEVGGNPVALAATGSDVWVVNSADGTVDRINTAVDRVIERPIRVGNQPNAIAAGPSGVWVANSGDDTVTRIDPDSGEPGPAIPVGAGPDGIAAADADSVWVANGLDGTVSRVDTRTRTVSLPIPVGAGPAGLTVADGSVWVANALEQSASRIRLTTGAVDTVADVGDGPAAAVSDGRFVWVAASRSGTVARIDPSNGRVHRFRVGASPVALAAVGNSVYVASQAFTAPEHIGGTLTVGNLHLPGTSEDIDPANAYDFWTLQPERFVYDGLMTFRAADGNAGNTVVPDLAAGMPIISRDGTLYTFTLRTGIRYSTGRIVQAEDFARGFRRVFTVGGYGNPALFKNVVGATHCLAEPATCDLNGGVTTDEPHHRLTIHLTAPDADLLYKLTYFVYPAPPNTPPTLLTTTPLPGTGPYRIASARHRWNATDRRMETYFETLTRNPHFRQWSFAAQPAGYPDVIKLREYNNAKDEANAVRDGTIDIGRIYGGDTAALAALVADLRLHDPDRLHAQTSPDTDSESLNTETPPFDNKLARQAINFAVDRTQLTNDVFGPGLAQPSCQMLPPNFPAYKWNCPYTRPGPKPYNGPDLTKARRLVEESGTRGTHVTVYGTVSAPSDRVLLDDLANALRDIGYKASVRALPANSANTEYPYDPRHHVQISGVNGWIADYPSPDTFYDPLLSCSVRNGFSTGFCDNKMDHLAQAAQNTARTDPAAARRLWTEIDQAVTDQAPWITLGSDVAYYFTASRVANYQSSPTTPLYSQLWVK